MPVSCLVVTSRRSRDRKRDFQLQTTQMHEASCLFSCKSILLRTSGKCQSIKRTACMLNFIYIGQSKWYLRFKISVQGPFNTVLYYSCYSVSFRVSRTQHVFCQTKTSIKKRKEKKEKKHWHSSICDDSSRQDGSMFSGITLPLKRFPVKRVCSKATTTGATFSKSDIPLGRHYPSKATQQQQQ